MHTTMLHLQISHTAHTGVTAQAAAAAHSTGSIQGSLHATGHRAPGEKRGRTYDCRPLSLFQVNLECESDRCCAQQRSTHQSRSLSSMSARMARIWTLNSSKRVMSSFSASAADTCMVTGYLSMLHHKAATPCARKLIKGCPAEQIVGPCTC
eukprot:1161235-Pelagomonas_calceolata.AAC.14